MDENMNPGEEVNLAERITRLMYRAQVLAVTALDVLDQSDVADPDLKRKLSHVVDSAQDAMNLIEAHPRKFGKLSEHR